MSDAVDAVGDGRPAVARTGDDARRAVRAPRRSATRASTAGTRQPASARRSRALPSDAPRRSVRMLLRRTAASTAPPTSSSSRSRGTAAARRRLAGELSRRLIALGVERLGEEPRRRGRRPLSTAATIACSNFVDAALAVRLAWRRPARRAAARARRRRSCTPRACRDVAMFSTSTTGRPRSSTWLTRYRFRSRFDASTMQTTASGWPTSGLPAEQHVDRHHLVGRARRQAVRARQIDEVDACGRPSWTRPIFFSTVTPG